MIEGESIFIDLKNLRRKLKRAQYMMEKSDRIIYGTPTLEVCTQCLQAFEMAYDFEDERKYYAKKLKALCTTLRLDIDDLFELNVIKGRDEKTNQSADSLKLEIVECVGRVDKGISKYVGSIFRGKTIAVK
jgi:hypothetical protein